MDDSYYIPVTFFFLFLLYLIVRPFTVLIHELGHGLTALIFSKEKITLYIGSYGNKRRTIRAKFGRLEIYFRYFPFWWNTGCCMPPSDIKSITKLLIIVVAGPAFSLVFSFLVFFIVFYFDLHASIKLFSAFFFGLGMIDFFTSISPNSKPISANDNMVIYNDGYQLKRLNNVRLSKKGIDLIEQNKVDEAAIYFEKKLKKGLKNDLIYRILLSCYIDQKAYSEALAICEIIKKEGYSLTSDELVNSGFIHCKFNKYEEGLRDYSDALKHNPQNKMALNNRGYEFNVMGRYDEAMQDLNLAIEIDPAFSNPFINRGFTKIMLSDLEGGLKDIEQSFKLDPNNAYAFRNLGVYYYKKGENQKALENFLKAKELDIDTHLVDHYINLVENEV